MSNLLIGESLLAGDGEGDGGVEVELNRESLDSYDVEAQSPEQEQSQLLSQQQSQRREQYQQEYQQEYQQQQPPQPRIIETIEEWSRIAGSEIVRVGEIAGTELRQFTRFATCTTSRVLRRAPIHPMSPIMEPWQDLGELQKAHKLKIEMMKAHDHEDHYDFALVLTPQSAYSFWAEHLDFRAEHLGELLTSVPSQDTVETQESDKENIQKPLPIDARPFLTPQTGIRRRRHTPSSDDSDVTKDHDNINTMTSDKQTLWSAGISDSEARVVKPRLSMFEKAVGVFTPSRVSLGGSTTRLYGENTPSTTGGGGVPSTSRRRWGNRPDTTPPARTYSTPARTLSSFRKHKRTSTSSRMSPMSDNGAEEITSTGKRRKILRVQDIPSQVVPRGIAARSNGMMQFLSALKRGVVVRRHRPGQEAVFVKILSNDGGDTIKFEPVDTEEGKLAFREQRVRYNRKLAKRGFQVQSQQWAHADEDQDSQVQNFQLPDFIAAEQYRRRQLENKRGLSKTVLDAATKLKNSGSIKVQDVIAVHPGRHPDPRTNGELGTSTLRRSKSEYDPQYTFSIIQKSNRVAGSKKNAVAAAERWHSGDGNDAQFKSCDFEAATEGEYWLVFRGFLLLHRDAASGRFASNRMAGFGSNYRKEMATEDDQSRLQADAYHEPRTIGWFERRIADMRKVDLTLELNGSAEPGAVPPPSDYFLGFKSPGTQIWSRLRLAGLETTRLYAIDPRRVMIKVRIPVDRLEDVAEVLRIKLKTRDGSFAPFRENDVGRFAQLNDELDAPKSIIEGGSLFRSEQRQKVIDFIIRSRIRDSGAELGQHTDLGKLVQARVPLHMRKKLESLYHAWFYFNRPDNWVLRDGCSMTVDPTDPLGNDVDPNSLLPRRRTGVVPNRFNRFFVGAFFQPLDSIEQYFGEQVSFYFAWLQHCSYHLVFLSILGFIVSICQVASNTWDHPIRPFFSVAVMLWSFFVLVKWRQRSNLLAYRWGTMDHKEKEITRPQFKGEYRRDELTGEWVVFYPSWKRYLKYLISFPINMAFTAGALVLILMVHANRDQMLARYFEQKHTPGSEEFHLVWSINAIGKTKPIQSVELNSENLRDPQFWFIVAGLPCLLGLFLPLLNFILMRISKLLNDFENYRTESHYRTALIVKVFSFRFVCYFATLYYYAYLSVGSTQAIENGILRVGASVFIYMTVAHYWGTFVGIYLPLLIYNIRRRGQKKRLHEELMQVEREEAELEDLDEDEVNNEDIKEKKIHLINKRLLLDQAQDELWKEVMLPDHDSFPEYINAVVQFTFLTCFSVVLPITPIMCLMNHLISMRLDAYKLCKTRRRPLAQTTGGIGVWEHVLHIVSVIAILTNCWLMGFTNAKFFAISEKIGQVGLFAVVVGWEHIMLLIKYIIQASTPKLPKSVRDKMEKEQYVQDRKRNSSMRQKKDRRSHSFRERAFTSPDAKSDAKSMGSVTSESPMKAAPESIMRSVKKHSKGPHGLMTIPSEDFSDCSPANSNKGSNEKRALLQSIDKKTFMNQNDSASMATSNNSKTTTDSDSQDILVPTPFHLGRSLDAEALAKESPSILQKRALNNRFHTASSSLLGTFGDDDSLTTSEATVPSRLPRPARMSDDASALAAARLVRIGTRRFPSTPDGSLHEA